MRVSPSIGAAQSRGIRACPETKTDTPLDSSLAHKCIVETSRDAKIWSEMNPILQRLREGAKRIGVLMGQLVSTEMRVLRETDFFCLRFFVTLELALFYLVGVVYAAVVTLPESRLLYASLCGSAGVAGAWVLRSTWRVGRGRF